MLSQVHSNWGGETRKGVGSDCMNYVISISGTKPRLQSLLHLPFVHRTREGHWPMHNDVPREGEEEGLIPQPSNPRSATVTYERHGTMCDESSECILQCLFWYFYFAGSSV